MFFLLCLFALDGAWHNLSGGGIVYLQHEPYTQSLRLNNRLTQVTWSGALVDDLPDGRGLLQGYTDGALVFSYKGNMRKGSFHGPKGKLFRAGEVLDLHYEGAFHQGYRQGRGKLYLVPPGGKKQRFAVFYEGEWQNQAFHGNGELHNKLERSLYKGEFRNGKYHGHGILMTHTAASVDQWGQRSDASRREGRIVPGRWQVAQKGRWLNGKFAGDDK